MLTWPLIGQETVSSPTTRAEQLEKKRQQRRSQSTAPATSWFQKAVKAFEGQGAKRASGLPTFHGFLPLIGTVSPGSGPSLGVAWRNKVVGSSVAWSFRGYQLYNLQFGYRIPHMSYFLSTPRWGDVYKFASRQQREESGIFAFTEVQYVDRPQEDFYGIGPDSRLENRTVYSLQETSYSGVFGFELRRRLLWDVRGGLLQFGLGPGTDHRYPATQTVFNPRTAPGLSPNPPDYLRFSTGLFLDFRDVPGSPHKGTVVGVVVGRFDDTDSNQFNFNRLYVDVRQFIPLGSPARTLALRIYSSFSRPDPGSTVPFYLMDTLGGSRFLHGYEDSRFRDNDLVEASAEYRWEPAVWLQFALFYDAGNVFPKLDEFHLNKTNTGYGIGVRFKTPTAVLLRIDYGRSDESNIVSLSLGTSF